MHASEIDFVQLIRSKRKEKMRSAYQWGKKKEDDDEIEQGRA